MSCPVCRAPGAAKYRPFCSRRCADLDLGRWFSGGYAIPSEEPEDIEKASEEAEAARRKPH